MPCGLEEVFSLMGEPQEVTVGRTLTDTLAYLPSGQNAGPMLEPMRLFLLLVGASPSS